MVNTDEFIKRLERIMQHYELSAAAFADRIQAQRSSISHLLTGRNKPSLEFVLKVVKTFPEVNLYWLLNGKGSFPASSSPAPTVTKAVVKEAEKTKGDSTIQKIVIFYSDGSFEAFDKTSDQ
ncbi:helix-turn-helix domain-containing protein [Poritiphilus flavus]|uniref:Helix-turn-helix domain-containing protein n=1 Tax=Poritiphilus flavus TaxID=2697053 RepID=A0A6L9EG92_9FLAO|nr:helix-turn-helix transcriptional regulator [Poritiphilus flavus]NAS13538.1 helix-turn-helix domain-containing protein [Poritiphilus flavus]